MNARLEFSSLDPDRVILSSWQYYHRWNWERNDPELSAIVAAELAKLETLLIEHPEKSGKVTPLKEKLESLLGQLLARSARK